MLCRKHGGSNDKHVYMDNLEWDQRRLRTELRQNVHMKGIGYNEQNGQGTSPIFKYLVPDITNKGGGRQLLPTGKRNEIQIVSWLDQCHMAMASSRGFVDNLHYVLFTWLSFSTSSLLSLFQTLVWMAEAVAVSCNVTQHRAICFFQLHILRSRFRVKHTAIACFAFIFSTILTLIPSHSTSTALAAFIERCLFKVLCAPLAGRIRGTDGHQPEDNQVLE